MKRFAMVLAVLLVAVGCFAQNTLVPSAGNMFDGGALFISSCSMRQYNSTTTAQNRWSETRSAFDFDEPYDNSQNIQWLVDNSEGEYDIEIDSCIWSNRGSKALLFEQNGCPYILPKGQWRSLEGLNGQKVYMRTISELKGWTTAYYLRSYKK